MDANNVLNENKKIYLVPAVDQAVRVMLCLSEGGNSAKSLTEICQAVGIHRSKAFSILSTLNEYGLVKKKPNRRGYMLGPRLLTLSGKMLENLSLPRLVEPILSTLAKQAGATVALGIISEDKTYMVAQYEGAPGIGVSAPPGYETPVTYGAHGKAIAAALTEGELGDLLANQPLFFHGSPDQFDKDRLLNEIAGYRRDGFASEMGDLTPGLNAIAAAVVDQSGHPVAYVSLVGFFGEQDISRLGSLTAEAARKISMETGNTVFWNMRGQ